MGIRVRWWTAWGLTQLMGLPVAAQFEPPRDAHLIEHGQLAPRVAATLDERQYEVGRVGRGYQFSHVASGHLRSDGSAVILDGPPYALVYLDATGEVVRVVEREGEGPGEFAYPAAVTAKGADSVVVEDDNNHRLSYFVGGEHVGDDPFDDPLMMFSHAGVGWHGPQLVLQTYSYPSPLPEEWFLDSFVLHELGSSVFDTVHVFPGARQFQPGGVNPFRASGQGAFTKGAVASAWTNRPEVIRVSIDSGGSIVIRWSEVQALTDSLWNLHTAYQESRGLPNAALRVGRRADVTGPLPVIGVMHGDDDGRLWVSQWSPDQSYPSYRVFSPEGEWLGWVEGTGGIRILDIANDRILGVVKDRFDVESVVVVPIRWSGPEE